MKSPIFFLGIVLLISINYSGLFAQKIILGQIPKKVPLGQKWVLTNKSQPLIELNEGALISGNICNAALLSKPGVISLINEGDYIRPNKIYEIEFNGLAKVPYANSVTYQITSITNFRCHNFPSIDFSRSMGIAFYPGQTVSVNGCLQSLELTILPFTKQEEAQLKQKAELDEKQYQINQKNKLIESYKKINDDIIKGIEPLKDYDITLDYGNDKIGLPKTLEYNINELDYNFNKEVLLTLLDKLKVYGRTSIRFDKKGLFKGLYDSDGNVVYFDDLTFQKFREAISLTKPAILSYNGVSYPVEFETNGFTLQRSQITYFKEFAFVSKKKSISFLDQPVVKAHLLKDPKYVPPQNNIEFTSLENSEENTQYLYNLIKKDLSFYLTSSIENAFKNEVPAYKLKHYAYHFKIQGNEINFPFQFIYIVHTKGFANTKTFYRFSNGKRQELASNKTYDFNSEKIDAIYIYNPYWKEIHKLIR